MSRSDWVSIVVLMAAVLVLSILASWKINEGRHYTPLRNDPPPAEGLEFWA